jgi:hypothetical protein
LAGSVAGDDDGAGGHAAVEDLAGLAMIDLGTGADINAHGDDGAFLDDDPLHDLGAGADEAVVLDNGGRGLDRLQDAANTDAAREMFTFLPIWAQEPTVAQVSTMAPEST